jgi:putative acetyltransferase
VILRPVADTDAQDLYGLLTLCFAEYPGCFVDPHEDMPDLLRPTSWLESREGGFWVVEDERARIKACIAVDLPEPGAGEMHRLYVRPDSRGQGLAKALLNRAEAWAIERGAKRLLAWSDTRFTKAHTLYESRGYIRQAETRQLNDISNSSEFCFVKPASVIKQA